MHAIEWLVLFNVILLTGTVVCWFIESSALAMIEEEGCPPELTTRVIWFSGIISTLAITTPVVLTVMLVSEKGQDLLATLVIAML